MTGYAAANVRVRVGKSVPQGLKPSPPWRFFGTAEAVPFVESASAKAHGDGEVLPGALKRSFPRINPPQAASLLGTPVNAGAPTLAQFSPRTLKRSS
jgi:hypothetical protein